MTENYERLKGILLKDKMQTPNLVEMALKNDVIKVLQSYFEIEKNHYDLVIDVTQEGEFEIRFACLGKRLINSNFKI